MSSKDAVRIQQGGSKDTAGRQQGYSREAQQGCCDNRYYF